MPIRLWSNVSVDDGEFYCGDCKENIRPCRSCILPQILYSIVAILTKLNRWELEKRKKKGG